MKKYTSSEYHEYVRFLDDTLENLLEYQRKTGPKDGVNTDLVQLQALLWDEDPFVQVRACRAASKIIELPSWYH
ncbi:MAG: hypothetical protein V4490_07920 [Pseudomonadota bacterium]